MLYLPFVFPIFLFSINFLYVSPVRFTSKYPIEETIFCWVACIHCFKVGNNINFRVFSFGWGQFPNSPIPIIIYLWCFLFFLSFIVMMCFRVLSFIYHFEDGMYIVMHVLIVSEFICIYLSFWLILGAEDIYFFLLCIVILCLLHVLKCFSYPIFYMYFSASLA